MSLLSWINQLFSGGRNVPKQTKTDPGLDGKAPGAGKLDKGPSDPVLREAFQRFESKAGKGATGLSRAEKVKKEYGAERKEYGARTDSAEKQLHGVNSGLPGPQAPSRTIIGTFGNFLGDIAKPASEWVALIAQQPKLRAAKEKITFLSNEGPVSQLLGKVVTGNGLATATGALILFGTIAGPAVAMSEMTISQEVAENSMSTARETYYRNSPINYVNQSGKLLAENSAGIMNWLYGIDRRLRGK